MAATTIKLRLKDGQREIEVEGAKNEIDALLERWWHGQARPAEQHGEGRGAAGSHLPLLRGRSGWLGR
jgi:hypothetical protein